MDRRVTPPKRVNTSTWGSPPPCKQALEQEPMMGSCLETKKKFRIT